MNQKILSLRTGSAELPSIMMTGTMLRHGEVWVALPREVVSGTKGVESVVFEVIRPEYLVKPSWIKAWSKAIRPHSFTMTFMPFLAVLLAGTLKGWQPSWRVGIVSWIGVLFLQISANVLNDVEDHLRLIDLPRSRRGSGVLQKGWLNARKLRVCGFLALGIGIICGIPAAVASPGILFWIGSIAALGVMSYSSRPFGMKYRVVGDIFLLILLGPLLTIGFSQGIFGGFDASIFWLGLYFGFAACGISHAGNLQDIEMDFQYGINSLASKLGFKTSRHLLAGIYCLSFLSLLLGVWLGSFPRVAMLGAGIGLIGVILFLRKVYQASGPASALLSSIRLEASRNHFFLGLSVCGGLLFQLLF